MFEEKVFTAITVFAVMPEDGRYNALQHALTGYRREFPKAHYLGVLRSDLGATDET
ncbi:hypothetical protein IFT84_16740 [Rhizobium sp. CFBP 8762]|uniref:hypothetical protein n=1 Tax=Rhizobium sp. CFBP 8762 TaxID=2775279 RepID=UPI00177D9FBC|nr:hypothetical protein [Rhizobium sp. CFBP 8762]MBD8556159.1 hypothetical protein [Rhizobium sp. CFBP 8762]